MNIFNLTYCYFYNKSEFSGPGRLKASIYVLILGGLYLLSIFEIIFVITDYKINFFSSTQGISLYKQKQLDFIYFIPCGFMTWLFYNKERSKKLLEKFHSRDEYVQQGDTNRVIIYYLIPFVVTTILMFLKQNEIL